MVISPELLGAAIAGALLFMILAVPLAMMLGSIKALFSGFALKLAIAICVGVAASFFLKLDDASTMSALHSLGQTAQDKLQFITDIARDLATGD